MSFSLVEEKYQKYDQDKLSDNTLTNLQETYDEYNVDNNNAEKKYNDAAESLDKSINDMINNIKDTYTDIEYLKKDIDNEKVNLDVYQKKFELGLITKIELDSYKNNVTVSEDKLESLGLDLNMKYAKLLNWSDLTKVVKK